MALACYCDSGLGYEDCCGIYHKNYAAPNALALMRSRYSAYVLHDADYILKTTFPGERKFYSRETILEWSESSKWGGLEIVSFDTEMVEFKAFYKDKNHQAYVHHEKSNFQQVEGKWYYVDGTFVGD